MTFKYRSVKRPDNTIVKAPQIPMTIFGLEIIDTLALVDSGADISAMSQQMAEILGINFSKKEINSAFGIGGEVKSVQTKIKVLIEQKHERYELDLPVKIILDKYEFPFLLGRIGFFDNFIITFDQSKEKVMLKKMDAIY